MALKRFTNGDKLKADQINYDENTSILDAIFPIGRGFIDFTNTDYSNYLGFTWERELVGMTAVGYKAGDSDFGTIGKTGGEKTHTLTINEMPSHKHQWFAAIDGGTDTGRQMDRFMINGYGDARWWANLYDMYSSGGNQPHNNLQPYKVVAYWKRVS